MFTLAVQELDTLREDYEELKKDHESILQGNLLSNSHFLHTLNL